MLTYFAAFEVFFEENLPKLFAHFKKNNLTPDIYLIDWWVLPCIVLLPHFILYLLFCFNSELASIDEHELLGSVSFHWCSKALPIRPPPTCTVHFVPRLAENTLHAFISKHDTCLTYSVCHTFSVRCVSEKTGKGLYEWSLPIWGRNLCLYLHFNHIYAT